MDANMRLLCDDVRRDIVKRAQTASNMMLLVVFQCDDNNGWSGADHIALTFTRNMLDPEWLVRCGYGDGVFQVDVRQCTARTRSKTDAFIKCAVRAHQSVYDGEMTMNVYYVEGCDSVPSWTPFYGWVHSEEITDDVMQTLRDYHPAKDDDAIRAIHAESLRMNRFIQGCMCVGKLDMFGDRFAQDLLGLVETWVATA